jgi:hypothetical protein
MKENTLTTRREVLKREISNNQTLMDVIYDKTGRGIQKTIHISKPVSPYITTIIIFLLILSIGTIISIIFGEQKDFPSNGLMISSWFALSCAALLVAKFNIRKLLDSFRDQVIDFIESVDDIDDFQRCITNIFFQRAKNISFSIAFSIILGFFSTVLIKANSRILIGVGFCTLIFISFLFYGISFYLIIMMLFIPGRLSRYQYRLYVVNPGRSKIVGNLSKILNKYTYIVASYVALITVWVNIFFGSENLFIWFILTAITINWIPIIIQFRTNQSTIKKIVNKGKLKTLTEIQDKIEILHAGLTTGDRKTINAINRLLDYYARIDKVRTSPFNLNALVNLINQLLIPIAAIVLANLDTLIGLIPL